MDNHPETIARLKFIGKLQKGDKINTRRMFVQSNGLITRLNRTFWNQDNRANGLSFVQETVRRAFDLLELYDKSGKDHDKSLRESMVKDIQTSMHGLNNLKSTYCDDVKFGCDIDALLLIISAKIGKDRIPEGFSSHMENGDEPHRDGVKDGVKDGVNHDVNDDEKTSASNQEHEDY
jgi:hypothetical protein